MSLKKKIITPILAFLIVALFIAFSFNQQATKPSQSATTAAQFETPEIENTENPLETADSDVNGEWSAQKIILLEKKRGELTASEIYDAMESWAAEAPEEAMTYLLRSMEAEDRKPHHAESFVNTHRLAEDTLVTLFTQWAQNEPESAISYIESISSHPTLSPYPAKLIQSELLRPAFATLWKSNPDFLLAWTPSISEDDLRLDAYNFSMANWKEQSPQAAAQWLTQYISDETTQEAATTISLDWAQKDPQAAAAWALSLEAGESQNNALVATFETWAKNDLYEAAAAINALEQSTTLDNATVSLVNRAVLSDPQAALEWAHNIVDESTRKLAIDDALNTWRETDPKQVQKWINDNDYAFATFSILSEEVE